MRKFKGHTGVWKLNTEPGHIYLKTYIPSFPSWKGDPWENPYKTEEKWRRSLHVFLSPAQSRNRCHPLHHHAPRCHSPIPPASPPPHTPQLCRERREKGTFIMRVQWWPGCSTNILSVFTHSTVCKVWPGQHMTSMAFNAWTFCLVTVFLILKWQYLTFRIHIS